MLLAVRLVLSITGVVMIVWVTPWRDGSDGRAGLLTLLSQASPTMLMLGLVLHGMVLPLEALRWRSLLVSQGHRVTRLWAVGVTGLGLFYNFVLPLGTTGGDVARAWHATRRIGRPGPALTSVAADRLLGLLGLVSVAGFAAAAGLLVSLGGEPGGGGVQRRWILAAVGPAALCLLLVFLVGFRLVGRPRTGPAWYVRPLAGWGLFRRVARPVTAFARRGRRAVPRALLLSMALHTCTVASVVVMGRALGLSLPWAVLAAGVPVVMLSATLPISIQGLGVAEAVALALFTSGLRDPAVPSVVGMLLLQRSTMLTWALLGGGVGGVLLRRVRHEEASRPEQDAA